MYYASREGSNRLDGILSIGDSFLLFKFPFFPRMNIFAMVFRGRWIELLLPQCSQ